MTFSLRDSETLAGLAVTRSKLDNILMRAVEESSDVLEINEPARTIIAPNMNPLAQANGSREY
jgi:hypothetical protein